MITEDRSGSVSILRLDHGKVNALDVELLDAIAERVNALAAGETNAVVLTGAGRAFSAGVDLRRVLEGGAPYVERLIPAISRMVDAVFRSPRPVVAAVNGAAIAGGCVLACACDWRVLAEAGAPIGASELAVGVPFPAAALEIMRHACGHRAEEVVYGGLLYTGQQATDVGLVHECVAGEALLDRAVAMAEEFGSRAPDAYRMAKVQLRQPTIDRIAQWASGDAEVARVWSTPGVASAIRAQLEGTARR